MQSIFTGGASLLILGFGWVVRGWCHWPLLMLLSHSLIWGLEAGTYGKQACARQKLSPWPLEEEEEEEVAASVVARDLADS